MVGKEFVTAGKAIFTVSNPKGERYTFRVCCKEAEGNYPEAWFVSVLTGPDNTSDYTYLGVLSPATGEVRLTAKSRYKDDTAPVKVVRWLLRLLYAGKPLPAGYSLNHMGRCGRCGRLLTVPESVESGIGPECARQMGAGSRKASKVEPHNDPEQPEYYADEDGTDQRSVPSPRGEKGSNFVSDGASVEGLNPVRDAEGEITHWTGTRGGRRVVVFND